MESFEALLRAYRSAAERYVKFKIPSLPDAEDVLQEVYLTAFEKFPQLKREDSFRPWLIGIARSKCADWFRARARKWEIPLEALTERELVDTRFGPSESTVLGDAVERLASREQQILFLYYWKGLPQRDIAARLGIPLGTVKSRLFTAKENLRRQLSPGSAPMKGETTMHDLPKILPPYTITPMADAPFPVRWEELDSWMLVPRLGEHIRWGLYDRPTGERTELTEMRVTGRAEIHGIEGVEIEVTQHDTQDYFRTGREEVIHRSFVAQLTDTHCRFLAECHQENGVKKLFTFLDGDAFLGNWGYGEDNCGHEVEIAPKGLIRRAGSVVTGPAQKDTIDIVDRCTVEIGGKTYDTVRVMNLLTFDDAIATEAYLDRSGRTVLWRRFNRDDWAFARYGKKWSEQLPHSERITVNGETYVHWYDCISDYISLP